METREQRYHPKQTHIFRLKKGSSIVALDGQLEIRHRDDSVSWLLDSAPAVSCLLEEGDCHILCCGGYVEIYAPGTAAVTGLILPPSSAKPWVMAVSRFLSSGVSRFKRRNPAECDGLSMRK
jgi:hypothetical protein